MLARPTFFGNEKVPLFNGLLYRIVNTESCEWAFFNNSRDYEFHVKYLFGLDSQISTLGDTTLERGDDGLLCGCIVYPLETKMFISGMVDGYESKLEALPLTEEYFALHPDLDEDKYYQRLAPPKASEF
ncbi:calpain-like cysteine peptidase, Clan CA, family C2 [Strigomonas culicis]|nr:calpain-like cysteine peptidase, Clan CA, family C2 [Strigomonas culicis]|eukprot:EPY23567.1 calpain-like cysteine peptidase, Clan CA, family C2 [Strigomonas culicis]